MKTELGPDATALGWVYQYALVDKTGKHSLAELRTFQDWYLRYWVQSVPGVAEVASIGGFQKQYQVSVDPTALLAYNIPLMKVVDAIRQGNNDVGGRLVEMSGAEYMVRGRGYAKSVKDVEEIVVGTDMKGTPILVGNLGRVTLGPEIRRGVADLDGVGDIVGGIIVMRQGENALNVIERVETKLKEVKPSLPEGVQIVTTYDRSELIRESIGTLKHELYTALIIVSIVILIFLWHFPSSIVPIITIPISIALAFIPMYFMGVTVNIMSISGITISIGVLVDGAIAAVLPYASRSPFETWILPRRHESSFGRVPLEDLRPLAELLKDVLSRLHAGLGNPDFNLLINTVARGDEGKRYFLWHVEIVPRLTTPAGFEMGSGMSINTILPEEGAKFLREVNPIIPATRHTSG